MHMCITIIIVLTETRQGKLETILTKIQKRVAVSTLEIIHVLQTYAILASDEFCEACDRPMEIRRSSKRRFAKDGFAYICSGCRVHRSVRSDSILKNKQCSIFEFMIIVIEFSLGRYAKTVTVSRVTSYATNHSVCRWFDIFRTSLLHYNTETRSREQLGGPGVIVEIDEMKLCGKRKYERGRIIPRNSQIWVLGAVDRDTGKCRYEKVESRSRRALEPIIRSWIAPGSIVHSDEWKSYKFLGSDPLFTHKVVNHSKTYKAPDGTHTNFIEGRNSHLRRATSGKHLTNHKNMKKYMAVFEAAASRSATNWVKFADTLMYALGGYTLHQMNFS